MGNTLWMIQIYWTRVADRANGQTYDAKVFTSVDEAVKYFCEVSREAIDDLKKGYECSAELFRVKADTQEYDLIWESHANVMTEGVI